ncbi:uncharacterized protein LOC106720593 [Papilio machaon]|uniref:uncharacterized protein LOC106720593 n=1 Tax=Papilio machaon TaxID=76193 RepID=UPI001E6632B4|nr:uncharacterized protein LOC106720593 [Papilio machaon]
MDGDTGKLRGLHNVKYNVEHERGSFAGIRFNRNKSNNREKKKQNLSRESEDTNNITTSDLSYVSVNIDKKSSIESKQYTKCARRREFSGKMSIDFKPLKSMLSSFSFVGKDKIKEITSYDSHNEVVVNEHEKHDLNLKHRVNNEVKVLYERDINDEENEQNISRRKSAIKSRRTKNSQISLFGFQRCIRRKRQLNYNLNVFYKFLQSDAKRDKCLCCKHYSFEDVNPEKPKKKSSFVKSQSDNPAVPNLLKVTERTTVSNIYLLKPKDAKKNDSLKKNEIPCSCLDLDKRVSILKKGDGFDNVNVQTLKTKSKEKNIATADHLKTRTFSGGPTAVNVCEPTRICKKWIKVEPNVSDSCKQSKSPDLFVLFCSAMKYFLFITIVIIWLPCILVLGLVWLITYPFRPHQDPKSETKKKTTKKPPQKPTKKTTAIKCAYCKNKKKCYALFRKNKSTSCITNKKKMKGTNCQKKCSRCTQYTTTTKLRLPESATTIAVLPCEGATSSYVGKKRHKSVSFKRSSRNRGTEIFSNASKSKQTTCSGCWKKKINTQKSVIHSLDKNQAKQDTKQKPKSNYKCQEIVIKSCQGIKRQNQKVEVCAPKSLSKALQTALSGVCSDNNEFASISKLPKNKSCNNLDNRCVKCTKKRKFSNRWCSTTTPTKHMAVSTTSVIQCVSLPGPGGCAYTQATNIQAAKGDKCEKNRTTVIKFFPPPRCKTNTIGSGINIRVCNTSKSTLAPFSSCCNRSICGKKSFKIISVNKLFPPLRPCLRTTSSNTIKPKTSLFSKSKERKEDDLVGAKEKMVKKVDKQKEKNAKKSGKEDGKNVKKHKKEEKKDIKKRDKEKDKNVNKREKEEKKIIKKPEKEREKSVKKSEKEWKKVKSPDKEKEKSVKKREKEEKKAKNPGKKSEKEQKKVNKPSKEKGKPVKKSEKEKKKVINPGKEKGNLGKKSAKEEKRVNISGKEMQKNVKKYDKPFYVKKYFPAPTPIVRHMSTNTDVEISTENHNTESPKSNTVVKYIPPPYKRSVTSGVNTSKPKSPSTGKFKSKSSSACFTAATKIIKYLPKPRSSSVGSITTEIKLPLKPLKKQKPKKKIPPEKKKPVSKPPGLLLQDRKSFARRRSQEMIADKPVHIYKFFPSPIRCTRSISIGARLQDEVKIPHKSSKSTTFPQKPLFRSLTTTMATNTCSVGPTTIFKYIKSKKSFITRGTAPQKFKENKVSKSDTSTKKGVDKTSTKEKKPGKPKRKNKKKLPSRVRFFLRGKSIGKRSTGSNTKRIYTKSREVMLKPSGPLVRLLLPKKPLTTTRGDNPRKEKFCFMREVCGFPKKQICKYRKTSVIIPKRIVIYKRPDQIPESSRSSRSAPSSTTSSSRSKKQVKEGKKQAEKNKKQAEEEKKQAKEKKKQAKEKKKQATEKKKQATEKKKQATEKKKQAKDRARQRADSVKQRVKEKAKEKDKDRATAIAIKDKKARANEQAKQRAEKRAEAIAKQKAEFRAQDLKAQEEMKRLQRKNREKKKY